MKFLIHLRDCKLIVSMVLTSGIAIVFLLLLQSKDKPEDIPRTVLSKMGIQHQDPAETPVHSTVVDIVKPVSPFGQTPLNRREQVLVQRNGPTVETQYDDALGRIQGFEEEVLERTKAYEIRWETHSLTAWASADSTRADATTLEDALRAPGYVAFMAGPDAMDEGVYHTMTDIAFIYFEQFPDAPRVTVSLVIGGGIRDRETFVCNGNGSVRVAGLDH